MGFFDDVYRMTPPWEIGRAQHEIVRLEESGVIVGDVLDVGCGTGENALYLAGRGHEVWGVDVAAIAVERAREKAKGRGIAATFLVHDVMYLEALGRTFDTVIDSGLFHTLSDSDRRRFLRSLATVLRPGGTYFMLAFSELAPGDYDLPRRLSVQEIRDIFVKKWGVHWIRPAVFENSLREDGSPAWLASITR
jgi:SAM-dependent methyltransferase